MAVTLLALAIVLCVCYLSCSWLLKLTWGNRYHGTFIWGMPLVHKEQGLSIFFACLNSTDLLWVGMREGPYEWRSAATRNAGCYQRWR